MNKNLAQEEDASRAEVHQYPSMHWHVLQRFLVGNERDPKDFFNLADDVWEAWPYFTHGRPTEATQYRFHFGHLRSFLKPYVKWYCYQRLLGSNKRLCRPLVKVGNALTRADTYLVEHDLNSLESIASPAVFAALWEAHLVPPKDTSAPPSPDAIRWQSLTHTFWRYVSVQFGAPGRIPPIAPHAKRRPVEFAADESQ